MATAAETKQPALPPGNHFLLSLAGALPSPANVRPQPQVRHTVPGARQTHGLQDPLRRATLEAHFEYLHSHSHTTLSGH